MITDFHYKGASLAKRLFITVMIVIMLIYVVLILYPLFNMFTSSFKTNRDILTTPFSLPTAFSLENFKIVWVDKGFSQFFINSIVVTVVAMAFVILFGSMAAYGISRYTYRGNTLVYMLFLSGIMLPLKAAIIPLFLLIKSLGLINSRLSVIMIFMAMGLPSTVFILSGFMKSIPVELEYAARIDGCNDFSIYRRIVMPMVAPAIALVTIYNAVPIWNDFFFPLVFLQSNALKTLPVGLSTFFGQHSTNWNLLFTGLSIAILPMLVLYLFMSKYFIKGMTAGAVK
ncbi:ABC-type sugar transport system, permease component [Sphaerochaeta pleomorpha str. Grapes]|uniref:ABC-type sugar transport system, permease component n=1 Tax=Sphaerochaeta pleomorpha (strain ATCC BAA-1885 / DSM 22778 / Grapes) TaxID=158190 RepID=G8QT49_SPHPG|nr:carbohydrate ABC transporter permease [Sphaerochaeta pleomorpha]AEV27954.1 ABC-type sugar transport system, permease component [Sphaerochaeta pleomorpha str. Grapes]